MLSHNVNDTLLVLISKVYPLELVSISLCNVSYKNITKALTNGLKNVMPSFVGPNHSTFVPGRQISDNIVI